MFLSLTVRYLINLEALNGVESVGNISRHRVAPMVIPVDNGYAVKYVPVISGESIAHGYQLLLADEAKSSGLPVGKRSSIGEFVKFTDDYLLKEEGITPPSDLKEARRLEVDIMLKDIVCDVGGFLYTGKAPVKRTSTFQVSYMVPAYGVSQETAALESQMHVRFSKDQQSYQIPYNVDVGSALYSFTFNLDLDSISIPMNYGEKVKGEEELGKQRSKRIQVALRALSRLLENLEFGAKKSRFYPIAHLESALMTLTDKPFVVTPSVRADYVEMTLKRVNVLKDMKIVSLKKIIGVNVRGDNIESVSTISEAISKIMKEVGV